MGSLWMREFMNQDEMEKIQAQLTDEEKGELANILEYPTIIHVMTDNFLKSMNAVINIANTKNDFARLCMTKLACACETLSNTNAIIISMIQNEHKKFLEEHNGSSESETVVTDIQN